MNAKFETLLTLLNNDVKASQLRDLYNSATNLQRIELIASIQEYLGINDLSLNEIISNALNS